MQRPKRAKETARQRKRRLEREAERNLQRWVDRTEARADREAEQVERLAALKERCLPQGEIDKIVAGARAPRPEREGRRGGKRPRSKDKDLDRYVKLAWEAGWRIEFGGIEHVKAFSPTGEIISIPSTPSRQRTIRRLRSAFRRNGLAV